LNSPELIRQVLVVDAKKYDKGVQFDKLRPFMADEALLNPDGDVPAALCVTPTTAESV
jgi:hypothetical protein